MSFQYSRANSIQDANQQFNELLKNHHSPIYYSGGTEILTLERLDLLRPTAVIDIKAIPACWEYHFHDHQYLVIGSCLPLTTIENKNDFPLLTTVSKEVADRTARNKITIGGNICGDIFYRESILPFLLANSHFMIANGSGTRVESIHDVFNQHIRLQEGEFLVQIITEKKYLLAPFYTAKIRQQWKTGYPLITVAALKVDDELRFAFSGLCPFPFRSSKMESVLNLPSLSYEERIERSFRHLPTPILHDVEGSAKYRMFVLKQILMDSLYALEGEESG
ncbi:FAD binding domain-containing protein [Bacillus sp. B15-48]|uniref:FAD binding domain-containing protein n=1 Tax=Bacillus sp. B15-48 TaxID=1548601 RepID=UPI00193F67D9|nr:FAD binding domain-containing protein [Bacillus sp. B15-48]MBM4761869.1 xanthine dehydrogenase [Bacillus sp. B15-48]